MTIRGIIVAGWLVGWQTADSNGVAAFADTSRTQALEAELSRAVQAKGAAQAELEHERSTFKTTMATLKDSRNETILKNRLMQLRASFDQAVRDRDHFRQLLESRQVLNS
jgi:multidrug resistance efflux pump